MLGGKRRSDIVIRQSSQVPPARLLFHLFLGLAACHNNHAGFEQEVIDSLQRTITAVENAGEDCNTVFADGWITQHQLAFSLSMQAAQAELQRLIREDANGGQPNCTILDDNQAMGEGCRLIHEANRHVTEMRLHGEKVFQQLGWSNVNQAAREMAASDAAASNARRQLLRTLEFYFNHMQSDITRSSERSLSLAVLIILSFPVLMVFGLRLTLQNRRHRQQLIEQDRTGRENTRKLELIGREVRRLRDLGAAIDATAGVLVFNQQHKVVSANEGFRKLRGLNGVDVQGQTIVSILGFEDDDLMEEIITAIAKKEIWRGEISGRREDGSGIWMYVLFYPVLDDMEELEGSLALILDITESKKTQMTLDRTRHLTALGEMAGGIAHEINNPLSVINGRVAILLKKLHAQSLEPALLQSGLEQIQKTVNRIARIVDSMRRLSRPDTGSDEARPEKIDNIVREVLEFMEDKLKKYRIHLTIHDVLMMSEAYVMLHGVGLSQILINLISNAVDAIEGSGASERWIRLELGRSSQGMVLIKVIDPGQGIPKPIREKIMDPFFTTKPPGQGTGLGLSLSQRIAEEHGGRISYDEDAAHTTFVLELPELKRGQEVA